MMLVGMEGRSQVLSRLDPWEGCAIANMPAETNTNAHRTHRGRTRRVLAFARLHVHTLVQIRVSLCM